MTINDYNVLRAIPSKDDDKKGLYKAYGTTINEIITKINLSKSKVSKSLKMFIDLGYVEEALSYGNSKSYIITLEGLESLQEMYGIKNSY